MEIRIFGEIGWDILAEAFIADLDQHPDDAELDLRINSVGGSVFEGLHIFNRLRMHAGKVTATIEGLAASMASVIAMAANEILMMDPSLMMIHNPATSVWGDQDDLQKAAETLAKLKETLIDAYVSKTGLEREAIAELMDEETWFTAQEAVDAGFADGVVTIDDDQDLDIAAMYAAAGDESWFKKGPAITTTTVNEDQTVTIVTKVVDAGHIPFPFVLVGLDPKQQAANATSNEDNDMDETERAALEAAAKTAALKEDADRRKRIRDLFKLHPGHEALAITCADDAECDVANAKTKLLDAIAKADANDPDDQGIGRAVVIEDAREKFCNGVVRALEAKCGLAKDDRANEMRGLSLREIARECAIMANVEGARTMRSLEFVGAAFSHSSSDFPNLLENVMGKVLLSAYDEWEATWQLWAMQGQVSDFKVNSRLKLGSFNNLATVLESGEFKEFSIGEEKETIQAVTKGNIFAITRQAIINDDLGAFVRIAASMGRAARRTVNADAYGVITANGDMSDGTALFHADHNNLDEGGGAVITVASISAAKAAMRKQKFATTGAGSDAVLDIRPQYLVVPVALEDVAKTLIASETDPGQANSRKPNIHRNTLTVISDPVLDADSAIIWYLMSAQEPTVEVDFLDGVDTPFLDSEEGFTVDGVRWKVRLDYGFDSIDYRGAQKNAGV